MARTSSETRLGPRLRERRAAGRALLVPYLTAGFPDLAATPRLMADLAAAGADVIELGVPFSDPLADGPTIQGSSQAALDGGASLAGTLRALRLFRAADVDTPVVLFTYLNPVLRRGVDTFIADAVDAGADGVLLTDLPLGADPELEDDFERSPLDLVRLIAPTTAPERAGRIAFGVAPLPTREGVAPVSVLYASGWAVPRAAPHRRIWAYDVLPGGGHVAQTALGHVSGV